uniref:PABS domain-containing protein n=1 Tax=candidate division WOR-3 bacterium TaxID=2052148 RepID=A0A7C4CA59_UNCW3
MAALNLVAIGCLGITAQLVIMRELITAFSGNELSIAVMLSVWIACEAAGALALSRLAHRRNPAQWFDALAFLSAGVSVAAVPAAILGRRLVGALPGETLGIPLLGLVTLIVACLPAFTHGALFVAGAGLFQPDRTSSTIPGQAYLWEGAGTALAATAVSFGLAARLSSLALVALAAVPLAAALLLTGRTRAEKTGALFALLALPALAFVFADRLEHLTWQRHWPGQTVSGVANSAYGKILSITRAGQRQVLFAGSPVFTSPALDIARTEQLVAIPLLAHPDPERVLIVGQALGGPAAVALRHGVSQLVTTEPDAVLARELAAAGDSLVGAELADPRHRRLAADPRRLLAGDAGRFDVIIITPAAPFSLSANRLFSLEAFRLYRRRLNPGGILGLNCPGSADRIRLTPDIERLVALRLATLTRAFPHVRPLAADFPLLLASDEPLSVAPETLTCRLIARKAAGQILDSAYLVALLDDFRQREFTRSIHRAVSVSEVNTDLHPRELSLSVIRESRTASPFIARLYAAANRLGPVHLLAGLGLLLILVLVGVRSRGRRFAVATTIASSGFCAAGLSALLLFVYQARFGSLYTQAALLIGAFMLGTVLGSAAAPRLAARRRAALLAADITIAALCFGAALGPASAPAWLFVLFQLVTGICLGAQFAAAGADSADPPAARTGLLAGLDLTGGALGMLACGLLLAPALGFVVTALTLAGIKGISTLGIVCARPAPD